MRYFLFIISLLFAVSGCTDDLVPGGGDAGKINPNSPNTLTFTVGVPSMEVDGAPKSRAIFYGNPLYYEDWIDTQDGFRVLFFISRRAKTDVKGTYDDDDNYVAVDPTNPLKDYFLFESTSRWVTQLPYDDDNNLRYRVTIPIYQIGDEDSEYRDHWTTIRNLLRTHDFKIAILANHPEGFSWTFKNSLLSASDPDDLTKTPGIKTINDIHHSVPDKNYADNDNSNRRDAYLMLVDNNNKVNSVGTMGPFIDWVIMRSQLYGDALGGTFQSLETARAWIRNYWIPDLKYNEDNDPDIEYETLYHNYRYLWSYWNFGGAAADNALPYSDKSKINPHLNDWEIRNGALLRNWITEAVEKNNGVLKDLSTAATAENKYDASLPLTFKPTAARAVITDGNGRRFYGVKLPALTTNPTATSNNDSFHFMLNAHGTVTVRYQSNGGTISVMNGSQVINAGSTVKKTIDGVQVTEAQFSITINDKPQNCFVFSQKGESTVYDIEFTQDNYIYLTDREGILPSSDHPIPMYGVQKYAKLEGFWDEDSSFDLTEGGTDVDGVNYNTKTISLLRAVAKIEVLIPKSLGVPKHVYMRSLNRNVRCEPMDVSTPTDELWKEHNNGCEWKLIQKRGTFYDGSGTYTVNSYKKKLAWYYGNWMEWGWNFNNYTQWKPNKDTDGPFPRIMNPYINRSDFAAFIDVTDYYKDSYYHFLFYMGENTLDASSQYNGSSGSIMVPHIEMRFDQRYTATSKVQVNTDLNLEDDDCYRIYFTEGGIAEGARDSNGASKIEKNKYGQYESNSTYLSQHWPIIRNHIYRFTVKDIDVSAMGGIVVDVQNRAPEFNFK